MPEQHKAFGFNKFVHEHLLMIIIQCFLSWIHVCIILMHFPHSVRFVDGDGQSDSGSV